MIRFATSSSADFIAPSTVQKTSFPAKPAVAVYPRSQQRATRGGGRYRPVRRRGCNSNFGRLSFSIPVIPMWFCPSWFLVKAIIDFLS